jgi:signal peptidase I
VSSDPGQPGREDVAVPPADAVPAASVEAIVQPARPARKSVFREYAEAIILAMLLAFGIRVFVVQAFKIPSGSMIPTLLIGDHILVSKLSYGLQWPTGCTFNWTGPLNLAPKNWRLPVSCYGHTTLIEFGKPARNDIIVFVYPEDEEKDFIKRIVGLPGDTVEVRRKVVYINGVSYDDGSFTQRVDPAVIEGHINPRDNFGPVKVPEHSYFMMGDNRDQSLDSRFWGFVSEEKIRGKAVRIYWSWNDAGGLTHSVRWERIGKAIR